MKMNIGEWMSQRAYLLGDKEGFVGTRARYSYQEMNQLVNKFANFLLHKGIQPGDRIALICKNHEDFIIAFFGSAKIGAITVPVNWRLSKRETAYILENSGARVVIFDDSFTEKVKAIKSGLPAEWFICSGDSEDTYTFATILADSIADEPKLRTSGQDTVLIMYTSGTSGKPKGAMLSHDNLLATSLGLIHSIDWWQQDRFLLVAPFFHIGGFAPLLANVHTGCTSVLMEDFDPVAVWKTIEEEKITTMMSVPTMLTYMQKTVEQVNADYSSLRYISCGASPVSSHLIHLFKQIGISIHQVYGITEYAGAVSFWKESMDPEKFESMGKAVMHGGFKIVDSDTDEELATGQVGEILCRGPQVFQGYWQNELETKKAFTNEWYRTGDLGKIDDQGYLYVVDRLKDMIISGGENIYSPEVENVLSSHPDITEAALVGVPHEEWGEVPRAFVVKREASSLNEEALITYCKEQLAHYKVPKEVVFVDTLPRNAVGKILKQVLKKSDQVAT